MRRRERRRPDGPIRVAYLTPTLDQGGAERQMLILAGALPRDEFAVRFILLSERGAMAPDAEALGVQIDVLGLRQGDCVPLRPRCLLAAVRAARRYRALTAGVDIVDAWLFPSMIFAAFVQPYARVGVLVGGRRNLGDLYRTKSWVRRAAARLAARRMVVVVANSRMAAAEAIQLDGLDPARVRVIPNAVMAINEPPGERAAARADWGFTADALVVGCVANYKPGKGLSTLLEAAASLRTARPELRYVLVGDGPLRARLEADVARLGLAGIVRLHGTAPDARRLYPAFDLFVQASESEGLPNVVLEAAAAGLPIVATAVGGTTEILTDGQDGLLVEPRSAVALAAAIDRLAADPILRERLASAALARSADFGPDRLVAATAALYRRLAGRS